MTPVLALLDDLLLVGDFEAAEPVLAALRADAGQTDNPQRAAIARDAIGRLVTPATMRHILEHVTTVDEAQFQRVKTVCLALGETLVRPLAEALSAQDRTRTRERLTEILVSFGAVGRREVEQLKTSANAAVRRTAVHLLREFGGSDALPDLTELLDDAEPAVQRDAVRAILKIGTDRGYRILEQALTSGTPAVAFVDCPGARFGARRTYRTTARPHLGAREPRGRARLGLRSRPRAARPAARPSVDRRARNGVVPWRVVGASTDRVPSAGCGCGAVAHRLGRGGGRTGRGLAEGFTRRPGGGSRRTRGRWPQPRGRRIGLMAVPRSQLAEELLRRFAASLRSGQLYSRGHPLIARNLEGLGLAIAALHDLVPSIVIGIVGDEVIVDELPVGQAAGLLSLVRRLRQIGIERVAIDRGVQPDEISALADFVAGSAPDEHRADDFPALPHIRVGRVKLSDRIDSGAPDMAAFRRLYADAVQSAEALWDSAQTERQPDATVARTMVDGLAQAVSQNRTALLALTALQKYDNYTFTHMVNVSILTMAQARALGVDGPLLREFGLAGAHARHRKGADAARDPEQDGGSSRPRSSRS